MSKSTNNPTVLDLFCGAGGMSLGFHNAGCELLGGIDKNPYAIKTHHRNFPNCKLKLDAKEIESITDLSELGIQPGEVDILIGAISVREAARLQSFPDNFVFDAAMTRMFELVGNSVPPILAEAIL